MNFVDEQDECRQRALFAFGTSKLFERRLKVYRWRVRLLAFLGLAMPLAAGGVVLALGSDLGPQLLPVAAAAAGLIGTAQGVVSIWALLARWDDELAYSAESMSENTRLHSDFQTLARKGATEIARELPALRQADTSQQARDRGHGIAGREERFAMRTALFYSKGKCSGCTTQPISMTPTDCDTCGNFPPRWAN